MSKQNTKRTATAPRPAATEDAPTPDGVHVVAEGETLDGIAEHTGVDAARLRRLNGIKRPDLIWPGMTLRTN